MAPVDRREHRQQRVRGAGASTVQASFGFDFGALRAKQPSLPPQRSGRPSQTPVQRTPRSFNGSARRHRSLSAPRSTKSQRNPTPKSSAATPQLGKRKRASPAAALGASIDEEDELSPDRVEHVRSVEKSRRLARTVSPVLEEPNEPPDELSVIDEPPTTARKTPRLVAGLLNGSAASTNSRRRSRSTDVVPVTPGMQPQSSSKHSFVLSTTVENTASNASQADDDDADELSPGQDNATTPRVVSRKSITNVVSEEGDGGIDELSPIQGTAPTPIASIVRHGHREVTATPIPIRSAARGRPRKSDRVTNADSLATPATHRPRTKQTSNKSPAEAPPDDEQPDELSPESGRTTQATPKLVRRTDEEAHVSDQESEAYEEDSEPDEPQEPTPRPVTKRTSPKRAIHTTTPSDKPPRKRQKVLGPRLAVSVMRMKGYGVRGVTLADTTRTILEEAIDHRLSKMLEKLQASQNPASRKELRSEVNLALSFKESLNEKLLDLQDANDVLTTNLKKLRIFKRGNAELRKDILALQNARQEIALEHDDVQAEFETEKAKVEASNTLSANMFDIEAAIQNGRKKAQREGREHEGPDVPLSMLLDTVGRDVGSLGGGLLANVKGFNGLLEKAAGWLEGRA